MLLSGGRRQRCCCSRVGRMHHDVGVSGSRMVVRCRRKSESACATCGTADKSRRLERQNQQPYSGGTHGSAGNRVEEMQCRATLRVSKTLAMSVCADRWCQKEGLRGGRAKTLLQRGWAHSQYLQPRLIGGSPPTTQRFAVFFTAPPAPFFHRSFLFKNTRAPSHPLSSTFYTSSQSIVCGNRPVASGDSV